jgi:hypothetical protein
MKDSKPIIFDDELREAFERPLKKYPKLQKVILKQPDETDNEDIFFTKLLIPYVSVMWYLCTHDSAVFDAFMAFIKDLGALESIPRLKTDGVFEVLSHLSSRNASILLSKIECTDGSYSELLDSLENGDKTRFVAALKDCNTTPINPPLKIFQKSILIEEKLNKLEFYLGSPQEIREDFFSKPDDYYVNNIIKEIFGFAFAPEESNEFVQAFANGMKAAKRLNSAENNDNGLTAILYDFMLGLFSSLKGKDVLNDDAVDVMNYILKRPPFGNEYYHYQKYWENEGSDDEAEKFLARYPQLQIHKLLQETNPNVEDEESGEEAEVVEEPQSTPQIEEPNKEEVKDVSGRSRNIPGQGRGRPKDCWIKGRSQIEEEQIGALIQSAIWKSLVESVKKLKYKKGIKGKTKEKQVKNLSAGLLYFALENIGWARVYDEYGIQSSFKRTMKFAGIARTSFEKNIRYIHEWFNLADECKEYPNQFDEYYSTYKETDPNMAFLIFENVNEIGKIFDNLKVKLKKTLDENSKL